MTRASLVLVAVLLLHRAAAQCELLSNCGLCSEATQCGWCASTQRCVSGSATGPSRGTCSAYTYNVCPNCQDENYYCANCLQQAMCGYCSTLQGDFLCVEGNATGPFAKKYQQQCLQYTFGASSLCPTPAPPTPSPATPCSLRSGSGMCNTCLQQPGCGWCAATEQCISGDTFGPTNGSCSTWFGAQCPTCVNAGSSCSNCLQSYGCGYCASALGSQMCFEGNASGPYRGHCNSWFYASQSCPNPTETLTPAAVCSSLTYCGGCVDNYGCGWCATTQTCMAGTTAPTSGTCGQWYPYDSGCPAVCDSTSCELCRLLSGCGWCTPAPGSYSNSGCMLGNSTGPYSSQCVGNWTEFPGTCPACASFTTCSACAGATGVCGWCGTTNQCVPGGYYGPTSGTCGNWYWYSSNCPVTSTGNEAERVRPIKGRLAAPGQRAKHPRRVPKP